jgi:hypothetical protein
VGRIADRWRTGEDHCESQRAVAHRPDGHGRHPGIGCEPEV